MVVAKDDWKNKDTITPLDKNKISMKHAYYERPINQKWKARLAHIALKFTTFELFLYSQHV